MFTIHNTQSGFARAARLLTTLVVMLSLVAFVSPATSLAAKVAPTVSAGFMKVHVTTYQHGNVLEGMSVIATSVVVAGEYTAKTDENGTALLKVPAGIYRVTTHVASLYDPYEPWIQIVTVAPDTITPVEARLMISVEMYPLYFTAIDPMSLSGVEGANVRIYDTNGQTIAEGTTNAKGLFATKSPKGTFIATALHPKYEAHKDFVKIVSEQATSTIVGLAPLGEPSLGDMQIHAIDTHTGIPIQGATATVYNANGKVIDQGMTDTTGTYYTCLPDGKYKVEVTAPMYVPYSGGHQITLGTLTHYKVLLVSMGQ